MSRLATPGDDYVTRLQVSVDYLVGVLEKIADDDTYRGLGDAAEALSEAVRIAREALEANQ